MASSKKHILATFLQTHKAATAEEYTHSRIGSDKLKLPGGSFHIGESEWVKFMDIYYQAVIEDKHIEYLTEKQRIENGQILMDFDFRYPSTITTRQHTKDHILDMIMLHAAKIPEIIDLDDKIRVPVYVLEKADVNTDNTALTKDGIHINIGLSMHKAAQVILRKKVLSEINNIWEDLPNTTDWNEVYDERVVKALCPWQMLGSRKPGCQAYMPKYHFVIIYDKSNNIWDVEEFPIEKFSIQKNFHQLSARYTGYPLFPLKADMLNEFEAAKLTLKTTTTTQNKTKQPIKVKMFQSNASTSGEIDSEETLDKIISEMFENISPENYKLSEAFKYVMVLPESYYGPGSESKWIHVGWALKNTSPDLFPCWLKFSCRDNCRETLKGPNGKFDWRQVPSLYDQWNKMKSSNLSSRSIIYWVRTDAPEQYEKIHKESIDFYVDESIKTKTEYDFAKVLHCLYWQKYVCGSIKHRLWYQFRDHRWSEMDSGVYLKLAISQNMHRLYYDKSIEIVQKMRSLDSADPEVEKLKKLNTSISEVCLLLKKNDCKNKIMNEAAALFYNSEFSKELDKNPYLLCFNNGVIDFEKKIFRNGQPDDYISKSTNIDYKQMKDSVVINQINVFMTQLFPQKELESYMWNHLSSSLIGVNLNQTFNVYLGSGANGKSALVTLMKKSLGDYACLAPLGLITGKRTGVGSTSSEVAQLDGIRYAYMQEPSRKEKINEGQLKELTGGDPIQARPLWKDSFSFVPMFKLVVSTNCDFEDTSNDDGTWRRMRYIPFEAKFLENPYNDDKYPRSECPYQFPKDKTLEDKLLLWAPDFISILVDKAYQNMGIVNDCKIVMAHSDSHREKQDYLAAYIRQNIRKKEGSCIKKTGLVEDFKIWYELNINKTVPPNKEIIEYMNNRFGIYSKVHHWRNIEMIKDEVVEDEMDAM